MMKIAIYHTGSDVGTKVIWQGFNFSAMTDNVWRKLVSLILSKLDGIEGLIPREPPFAYWYADIYSALQRTFIVQLGR